jgi:quercetin 2,3-dioxygenase
VIEIRRDAEIYSESGGWFQARWHFSFAGYRDPRQMGIGPLRVFNDDRLIAGAIWPMHPHADVEGMTYVVEGTFAHADSMGNDGKLQPGAIQRMTLGSGAEHSEQNGSETEPMRFLQFWILPDTPSLPPSLEQRQFTKEDRRDTLLKVVGPEGGDVVKVHQDASTYVASIGPGAEVEHGFADDRAGYLYLIEGAMELGNGEKLETGDAAKIYGPEELSIRAVDEAELILIDVPRNFTPVGVWAR